MVTVMSYLPEARFIGFHRHGSEMNEVVFHCLHHMLCMGEQLVQGRNQAKLNMRPLGYNYIPLYRLYSTYTVQKYSV